MTDAKTFTLEDKLSRTGVRMTAPRRVLSRVLGSATDHPDVEELHRRAQQIDPGISLATVYRTVRLFEQLGIVERHAFSAGRAGSTHRTAQGGGAAVVDRQAAVGAV